jgi:hypothetical protein
MHTEFTASESQQGSATPQRLIKWTMPLILGIVAGGDGIKTGDCFNTASQAQVIHQGQYKVKSTHRRFRTQLIPTGQRGHLF